MEDEAKVTLEVSDNCVIAECDGVRAEVRGADAIALKTRLAEYAIGAVREIKATRRYEREQMEVQRRLGIADLGGGAVGDAAVLTPLGQRMLAERQHVNRGYRNY